MWTEPVVTVAAVAEPVSLAEAKAQCRVDGSDSDADLAIYIAAARDYIEKYTGLKLSEQTVTFSRRGFCNEMPLPVAPVQSLAVDYLDTDRASQTLSASVYSLGGADTLRPVLRLVSEQSWPSVASDAEAVTITAVVGYTEIPAAIKQALLLMIGYCYEIREDEPANGPTVVDMLLANYRIYS